MTTTNLVCEEEKESVLTLEIIEEARENSLGYCTRCQEWTGECVEPDIYEGSCPVCEQDTLYGAEELVIMGLVEE